MAKRLAGKRWFHAAGQRDAALKQPKNRGCVNQKPGCWPDWAKSAYIRGYRGLWP